MNVDKVAKNLRDDPRAVPLGRALSVVQTAANDIVEAVGGVEARNVDEPTQDLPHADDRTRGQQGEATAVSPSAPESTAQVLF